MKGKIITKGEADKEFGPVLQFVDLSVETLGELINQTTDRLMFRIINNQVNVLDDSRSVIYTYGVQINPQDVFTVFSVSLIRELLSGGIGPSVRVEQRSDVLSITYGDNTLEFGTLCPPYCS
jgi:hypothetical protein